MKAITILVCQKHRPGATRRGAFRGRAPQMTACALPKWGLCPDEINRLGATRVQIEAVDSILLIALEFVIKNVIFVDSHGFHETSRIIWNEYLFFLVLTLELAENPKIFEMKTRIVEILNWRPFFLVFTSEIMENRTIFEMKTRICGNFWIKDLFLFFWS